jgi:hypothetical protein
MQLQLDCKFSDPGCALLAWKISPLTNHYSGCWQAGEAKLKSVPIDRIILIPRASVPSLSLQHVTLEIIKGDENSNKYILHILSGCKVEFHYYFRI